MLQLPLGITGRRSRSREAPPNTSHQTTLNAHEDPIKAKKVRFLKRNQVFEYQVESSDAESEANSGSESSSSEVDPTTQSILVETTFPEIATVPSSPSHSVPSDLVHLKPPTWVSRRIQTMKTGGVAHGTPIKDILNTRSLSRTVTPKHKQTQGRRSASTTEAAQHG
jgi:hypothetical protein